MLNNHTKTGEIATKPKKTKILIKSPLWLLTAVILAALGTLGSVKLIEVLAGNLPEGMETYTAEHVYYRGEAAYAQAYYYNDDYKSGYLTEMLLPGYTIGCSLSPDMPVAGNYTYDTDWNEVTPGTTLAQYADANIGTVQGDFQYKRLDSYANLPVYCVVDGKTFVCDYMYFYVDYDEFDDISAKASIEWEDYGYHAFDYDCDGQSLADYLQRIIVHRDYQSEYEASYNNLTAQGYTEEEAQEKAVCSVMYGSHENEIYNKMYTLATECMTPTTVKTDFNGTAYNIADLNMLDMLYIQSQNNGSDISVSVSWTEGTVNTCGDRVALAYNEEEGFSFSPEALNVAYGYLPSFVRFTDADGNFIRDCPMRYQDDVQSASKIRYLWCTGEACLYAVSIPDEMILNGYGSGSTSVQLPVSISMLYDFSRYPDAGMNDAGLNDQRVTIDNKDYDYSLGDSFWYNTFTLGGADDSPLPSFTPPGYTGSEACALAAWRVKDVVSSKFGVRASISLSSVKNYITYTFNSATGCYEGEFKIEPLFVNCYISLTYHANNYYDSGYCHWKSGQSVVESYIYRYKDDSGGVLQEPEPPTVTFKKPSDLTYVYPWGDEGGNLAEQHRYGETFAFWSADDIQPDNGEMFDSDNGEIYTDILESYSGTRYPADTEYGNLTGDIDIYSQWIPLRYHLTYDFQSPSGDQNDVMVFSWDWWYGSTDITDIFITEQICCKEKTLCVPPVSLNYDIYECRYINQFQADPNGNSYDGVKLAAKEDSSIRADWIMWSNEPDGEDSIYGYDYSDFKKGEGAYDYYATVYGIWEQDKYNLVYDANTTDTVTDMPTTVSVNAAQLKKEGGCTLSTQKPKRSNYAFDGWYLTADLSGDAVTAITYDRAETQQSDGTLDNGDTITVYAKWVDARIVTYYANVAEDDPIQPTGKVPTDDTLYRTTWKATVKGNAGSLARTGYVFNGWNTEADGSGIAYAGNGTEEILMTENVNLYAQWDSVKYRLTYQPNAKKTTPTNMPTALPDFGIGDFTNSDGKYTVPLTGSPESLGYEFKGWGKTSSAQIPDAVTLVALSDFKEVEGGNHLYECKVYAIWEKVPFAVNYHANKDRFTDLGTVAFGSSGKEVPDDVSLDIDNFTYDSDNAVWYWDFPDDKLRAEGFTFLGWNPDKTATAGRSGRRLTADADFGSERSCTLYAVWQENVYALRYEAGEASSPTGMPDDETDLVYVSSEDSTKNVKNGKLISDDEPSRDGYVFKNWKITYTDSDGTHEMNLNPGARIPFAAFAAAPKDDSGRHTVTAVAQWTKIPYKVIYHDNSESIENTAVENMPHAAKEYTETFYITNVSGSQYTLQPDSTPAAADYLFQGWGTAANAADTVTKIAFTAATTSYDVYAVWQEDLYTLNFYDGDTKLGSQTARNSTVNTDGGIEITRNDPAAPDGQTFLGWSLTKGSDTVDYKKNQTVPKDKFTDKVADVYAVWKAITYTLNFNDGDTKLSSQEAAYADFHTAEGITIATPNPNKTGNDFLGWSKTQGGTSLDYQNGDLVKDTEFGTDNTATVYAVWQPVTYTLNYYDGENKVDSQTESYTSFTTEKGIRIGKDNLSKDGSSFLGWTSTKGSKTADYQKNDLVPDTLFGENRSANVYAVWKAVTYTLKYDANGKTLTNGTTLPTDETFKHSEFDGTKNKPAPNKIPEAEGYTFTGWKITGADGQEIPFDKTNSTGATVAIATFDSSREATAVAQWKAVTYTLKYDANGKTLINGTTLPTDETFKHSEFDGTKNKPAPDKIPESEGYTFTGWKITGADGTEITFDKTNSTGATVAVATFDSSREAIAVAQWKAVTYTLKYDANGKTLANGTTLPTDETFKYSEFDGAKNKPAPDRIPEAEGYTFTGWKITGADGTEITFDKTNSTGATVAVATFDSSREATAVAQWKAVTYTLKYDANGKTLTNGTTLPTDETFKYSEFDGTKNKPAPDKIPEAEGYTFTGWKITGADGTEISFDKTNSTGATVAIATFDSSREATAVAQWKAVTYTLKYDANGKTLTNGTTLPTHETFKHSEFDGTKNKPAPDKIPEAEGYTFTGWKITGADGVEIPFDKTNSTGATLAVATFDSSREATAVAQWTPNNHTITYNANSGEGTEFSEPVLHGGTHEVWNNGNRRGSIEPYTKPGHQLDSWNTKANGEGTTYDLGGKIENVTANLTLYAVWKEETYTLHFFDKDQSLGDQESKYSAFNEAQGIEIKKDGQSKEGYKFLGWSHTKGAATAEYKKGDVVPAGKFTANQATVYAVWEEITYLITYDPNGGTGNGFSEPVTHGGGYTLWDNADVRHAPYVRTGYKLLGWNTNRTATTASYTLGQKIDSVTAGLTLYAVWQEDVCTLHFYDNDGERNLGSQTEKYTAFTAANGIKITQANPSKSGYTFQGWSKTMGGTDVDYRKGDTVPDTQFTERSADVYAVWKEITVYTIHYDGNDKGKVNGISRLPADKKMTLEQLEEGYKLTGVRNTSSAPRSSNSYDFVCWCLTKNHESDNIRSEVSIADFNDFAEDNVLTMYAIWVTHIDVTYRKGYSERVEIPDETVDTVNEPNDSLVSDSDAAAAEASVNQIFAFELNERTLLYRVREISELDVALVYEGYELDYWMVTKCEGTITHFIGVTSDEGVVAQSGAGEPQSADPDNTQPAVQTEIIEVGGKLYPNDVVDLTGSVTLEAHWALKKNQNASDPAPPPDSGANHYTVTYDANGGKGSTPQDSSLYVGGETVTVAAKGNLTRTDCAFVEWNTERDGSGTGYNGDGTDSFTMPKHDVTLYAIWRNKNGELLYDSPGTGDSLTELLIALGAGILALSAVGVTMVRRSRRNVA